MTSQIWNILIDRTVLFFFGIAIGFVLAFFVMRSHGNPIQEKEEDDDDTINPDGDLDGDGYRYYVKLPDDPAGVVRMIEIEDPIHVDRHYLIYKDVTYKISHIFHKVDGHSIVYLDHTHDIKYER